MGRMGGSPGTAGSPCPSSQAEARAAYTTTEWMGEGETERSGTIMIIICIF